MVSIDSTVFTQGDNNGEPDEYPERRVQLSAYRIDRTEVSNAAYKACVDARGCDPSAYADDSVLGRSNHPVVGVTWEDAKRFCEWLGRRLPTEAEWEHAARGNTTDQKFPWKGGFNHELANTADPKDKYPKSAPIKEYPDGASPYGLINMSGNVAEWVFDFYNPTEYRQNDESVTDPEGPSSGRERVVRGGSYKDDQYLTRVSARAFRVATQSNETIGFRCAADG